MTPTPRSARLAVAGILAILLAPLAGAAEPQLDFDVLYGDDVMGRQAGGLRWSPDGTRLLYRWEDKDGDALWLLNVSSRKRKAELVFRPGEGGSDEDFSLDGVIWSPDGESFLFESGGDLHLFRPGGQLQRLTDTEEAEKEPAFSPDGKQVVFIRGWDLYLVDVESGAERRLTHGGERNLLLHGITDWVYWEEIWGRDSTGFWWSPDGRQIVYYEFDEEPVHRFPLVDFTTTYPTVTWQRYPKAGTENPRVRLGVLDIVSGGTTWLKTGPDPTSYLARVDWHPDRARIAVQRLNRDQDRLDLLLCNISDGACRTILTETSPTWVNIGDEFRWLPDGRFVWSSERSGRKQLYLYAGDGTLVRELTGGEQTVTSLLEVNAPEGWVVYAAHGPGSFGAAERRIYKVRLDGGKPQTLAERAGWNRAQVAPVTGNWVHSHSTVNQPTVRRVRGPEGEELAELPSSAAEIDVASLPEWEAVVIDGPDGAKLPAQRLLPVNFDESRRYPVIMYHYGGPASQVVRDSWGGRRGLWERMMAERGFLMLKVDNEASVFFGKDGADRIHRRFGPLNLAAQQAAVEYLQGLPFVDADRIGLWGWSGGGSNTLYCLLNSPGTWRAGVSGAPVTDWRLYDTIWTERYLDHPDDNPEGYENSSAVTYAANLQDALLIVHGTADDNVHAQNSLVMSHELIKEGKSFEQAIHPRQKHGYGNIASRHFYEKMTEFFERQLGAPFGAEAGE